MALINHTIKRDIILDSIAEGVLTVDCNLNITSFNRLDSHKFSRLFSC